MKSHVGFAAFVLPLVLACTPCHGATVTIGSSKDNTLFESLTGDASNGQGDSFFAGRTGPNDGSHIRRGTIAFDLASALPANALITGVSLTLFLAQEGSLGFGETVSLHELSADWGEGTSFATSGRSGASSPNDATWLHRFFSTTPWATPGGDFVARVSASATMNTSFQAYTWTGPGMVQDVQGWLNSPSTNFGWIIIGDETITNTALRFNTKEALTVSNRPQLSITYTVVPEPGSAAMLSASALLLLGGRRSRRPL